jgi:hypothetical protein
MWTNAFIIQDALLALGLTACLCLFLSAKREIRREARRQKQAVEALAAQLADKLQALELPLPEPSAETTVVASPVRPGFNLTRRVQALRLLRRGQDIAHVAAVLGVSRREIELLIRVQQLATARPAGRVN